MIAIMTWSMLWSSGVSKDWIYISHAWCTVKVALYAEHT